MAKSHDLKQILAGTPGETLAEIGEKCQNLSEDAMRLAIRLFHFGRFKYGTDDNIRLAQIIYSTSESITEIKELNDLGIVRTYDRGFDLIAFSQRSYFVELARGQSNTSPEKYVAYFSNRLRLLN